jgi:REP-associated tyrosine transposase
MTVPKRHIRSPGAYFVTSRTWQSRALFLAEPICNLFMTALLHYRDEAKYALHAFVLMPDHFHLLLTPSTETSLERAVQYIKGGSARRIGEELKLRFPVWQRGFSDHRIRDAADYGAHLRYIENNPVKKKFVARPEGYPWSSASGKYTMDARPQRLKPASLDPTGGTAEAVP